MNNLVLFGTGWNYLFSRLDFREKNPPHTFTNKQMKTTRVAIIIKNLHCEIINTVYPASISRILCLFVFNSNQTCICIYILMLIPLTSIYYAR